MYNYRIEVHQEHILEFLISYIEGGERLQMVFSCSRKAFSSFASQKYFLSRLPSLIQQQSPYPKVDQVKNGI
jgi:hypothetical protein